MNLKPALANLGWAASSGPDYVRFLQALEQPEETQSTLLHHLLARNANSAYGRAHDFADIRCYEDFARNVPLVDYEDLEPWIERIRTGEKSVLTVNPVQHLIPSSGSTGAQKLIPFTAGCSATSTAQSDRGWWTYSGSTRL